MSQHVLSEVVGLHLLGFCFISWISTIHRETIYGFSKTNTWILRSFDFNSVLTRQTSEKVAFKSGFDNLLEYFLPRTFARIISVLPEKIQKFLWLGGLQPPSPPRLVRLWWWPLLPPITGKVDIEVRTEMFSWCAISWFHFPWNVKISGNYSSWLVTWRFCVTRENPELSTDNRDFTTLIYVILRPKSSEWLESSMQNYLHL